MIKDDLAKTLEKIQRAVLILNKEKCHFSKNRITFLGQIINRSEVHPDPDKVSTIMKIGTLENESNIRRFLGIYNQLSKFMSNLADEAKPLRDLLRTDCPWMWERPQQDAHEKLKILLSSTSVLALYDLNARTIVSADASSHGLGAVLLQEQMNGDIKPLSCISKLLFPTKEHYARIEKEALAFTWASGWPKVQYQNGPRTADSFVQH